MKKEEYNFMLQRDVKSKRINIAVDPFYLLTH